MCSGSVRSCRQVLRSTVPLCVWIVFVLVSTPVVPVMLPLVSVTVATVSLEVPMANVAPLTLSLVVSLMRLLPPSVNVPPSSSTVPVPAFKPVASMVTEPVAAKNWLALPDVVASRLLPETANGLPLEPMPVEPALSEMIPAPLVLTGRCPIRARLPLPSSRDSDRRLPRSCRSALIDPVLVTVTVPPDSLMPLTVNVVAVLIRLIAPLLVLVALKVPTAPFRRCQWQKMCSACRSC